MGSVKTLILSGGGGRGAFHAGVYQYLSQREKQGVCAEMNGAWEPDIVVGTSIGAVNGAAIVQGIDADSLADFWRSLREHDIEGMPPGMSWLTRWAANLMVKKMIGVKLKGAPVEMATSTTPHVGWNILPRVGKFGSWVLGRWSNFLDTGPLRQTLINRLGLDEQIIAKSKKTLLINATNVSSGRRVTFSNKAVFRKMGGELRNDVVPGINITRILASCSIPMVYPWTYDEGTMAMYWDGAVVNNTPIGVALDAAENYPETDSIEAVVVMMTPWRDPNAPLKDENHSLPNDFSEAITWALDWALLASFRERLDLIDAMNRLGRIGRLIGDPELAAYREVKVTIVAPDDFFPAARILDYDQYSENLIQMGYQAAERAFQRAYPFERAEV